jgi:hypothetical protein
MVNESIRESSAASLKKGQRPDWRVVNSEQTRVRGIARFPGWGFLSEWVMAISKNDKHREYAHYAAHCLEMVPGAPDEDFCAIQRKMAAEWLKLADAALTSAKADDMM